MICPEISVVISPISTRTPLFTVDRPTATKSKMQPFVYNAAPSRIVFAAGSVKKLPEELRRLQSSRPLILTTPQQVSSGKALIKYLPEEFNASLYTNATMHTPEGVTNNALEFAKSKNVDSLVAIGGGSTTGLAKAISFRTKLPQIIIPTTYAGSEVTPILGETKNNAKTTMKDSSILPNCVIYDANYTLMLPISLTITSAINSLAHAIEALYSPEKNPIVDILAVEGIKSISIGLESTVKEPENLEARSQLLYGAWLCGTCLGSVGMALHHKLCHTLGGTFNTPHADTHTIILPHAVAYNAPGCPEAIQKASDAFGTPQGASLAHVIYDFTVKIGGPTKLKDFGVRKEDLAKAADAASKNPYPNPVPLDRQKLLDLFENAWEGRRPQ